MSGNIKQDTLQKCKSRENETPDQHQKRLSRNRENKAKRKSEKNAEEHKINKFVHKLCPTCNEHFPSIKLVQGECHHCYNDKNIPKKFSAENNMDPGDVPKELQGLTEIEEMLIAQTFPVISEYCLRGG
ncbi:32286_t:CDS:2, partial [Gigaspora margarita]